MQCTQQPPPTSWIHQRAGQCLDGQGVPKLADTRARTNNKPEHKSTTACASKAWPDGQSIGNRHAIQNRLFTTHEYQNRNQPNKLSPALKVI
jgi:hypothetical protein